MSSLGCLLTFFILSFGSLCAGYMDIFVGGIKNLIIPKKTTEKLKVREDSILRKIIPFKKAFSHSTFGKDESFLLVNVIAYLIIGFIFFNGTILLLIDKLIIDFLPDVVFFVLGFVSMGIPIISEIVLRILIGIIK